MQFMGRIVSKSTGMLPEAVNIVFAGIVILKLPPSNVMELIHTT